MSDTFDHEMDAWESMCEDFHYGMHDNNCGPPRSTITCKYCHESGFRWIKTAIGYRLYKDSKIHSCIRHEMESIKEK